MTLVDTHTHIYLDHFDMDRAEVLRRALDKEVKRFVLPNVDLNTIPLLKRVVKDYPDIMFPAMGLHPTSVKADYLEVLSKIEEELNAATYYAIGEIGIDLYWDKTFLKQQQLAFAKQIEWGIERDIPIIIHARDSFDEIFEVLENYRNTKLRGVFHCFTGNKKQAKKVIDLGLYLGIGGVLTFKNSGLEDVIGHFELENFVLETDAPYLAPVPFRGKRNEPSYVRLVARKMADIFQLELEKVAEITTNNAKNLFNLDFI